MFTLTECVSTRSNLVTLRDYRSSWKLKSFLFQTVRNGRLGCLPTQKFIYRHNQTITCMCIHRGRLVFPLLHSVAVSDSIFWALVGATKAGARARVSSSCNNARAWNFVLTQVVAPTLVLLCANSEIFEFCYTRNVFHHEWAHTRFLLFVSYVDLYS